jgi:regulator of replication initiation timing
MDENTMQIIESLKQEIKDLKRELETEKEENQRLRRQLVDSSGQMKPSIKKALAQAGPGEGAGSDG